MYKKKIHIERRLYKKNKQRRDYIRKTLYEKKITWKKDIHKEEITQKKNYMKKKQEEEGTI